MSVAQNQVIMFNANHLAVANTHCDDEKTKLLTAMQRYCQNIHSLELTLHDIKETDNGQPSQDGWINKFSLKGSLYRNEETILGLKDESYDTVITAYNGRHYQNLRLYKQPWLSRRAQLREEYGYQYVYQGSAAVTRMFRFASGDADEMLEVL